MNDKWQDDMNALANAYVGSVNYSGSYDALGLKQVFIAGAGAEQWSSPLETVRALLAGMQAGRDWRNEND